MAILTLLLALSIPIFHLIKAYGTNSSSPISENLAQINIAWECMLLLSSFHFFSFKLPMAMLKLFAIFNLPHFFILSDSKKFVFIFSISFDNELILLRFAISINKSISLLLVQSPLATEPNRIILVMGYFLIGCCNIK